jgi:hypothetical protein
VIALLAIKPLLIAGLTVSAIGLTVAGETLQRPAPATVTRIVPTVIRLPGHTTVIVRQTVIRVPGATRTVPSGTAPPVTVTPAPVPGPTVTRPGPTVTQTAPGPTVSVTVTITAGMCVHPPGQKCRRLP